jgi:Rab family protein
MQSSVKVVLLGDSGVGKTSIVSQYIGSVSDSVSPTIGAAFVTRTVTVESHDLELFSWGTAGQEVYRGLAPMYSRSASVAIIVSDVTNPDTYRSVDYWIRELKANVEETIVIIVCANKMDLEGARLIDPLVASAAAVGKGALYAETSAGTGAGIEKMFQKALSALVRQKFAEGPSQPTRLQVGDGEAKGCCR